MNNRIIEILQNPELLVSNDIEILEKEISKNPFVQSYRAVQLLATHRFKEENYASKLSETAAFTTDKKILYHLIHQKDIAKSEIENEANVNSENFDLKKEENEVEKPPVSKLEKLIAIPETKFQEIKLPQVDLPKEVFIDGELNRILFEGEEDFLNEENETIDLEATQEAGKIVIASKNGALGEFSEATRKFTPETIVQEEKINKEENIVETASEVSFHGIDSILEPNSDLISNLNDSELETTAESAPQEFTEATPEFTTETIIDEDKIKSEENLIESTSELSFHGSQEFLPDVKIEIKRESSPHFIAENKLSKHEAEMQKLIAEVEAKMKKSSVKKIEKEEEFEDTHSLDFSGISHEEIAEKTSEMPKAEIISISESEKEESNSPWKPMDFSSKRSAFRNNEIIEKRTQETESEKIIEAVSEEIIESKPEESQINQPDQLISKEVEISPTEILSKTDEISSDNEESNIPVFINTWQSWLKLNPEIPVLKETVKQKAIESFIEKEPRISKLKEESSFVIKDKGDNISHLMTETLANLYLDQKLYSKAQKAFQLLIIKEPKKAEKFEEKLLKIKELRNQK